MSSFPISGMCALCHQVRELRDSHLVPKALYRLTRLKARGAADPVIVTSTIRRQTSFQARKHLLCGDCEARFDRNGENWVMRHCYRGYDRFRLRDLLGKTKPIYTDEDEELVVYDASGVAGMSIEKMVYFAVSVFWRASVCDWESSGQPYAPISLGTRYQEQVRQFLLGEADFPQNAARMLVVSQLPRPHVTFSFPYTTRLETRHAHTLHIPGLTFQLSLGAQNDPGTNETCIVRSAWHPILVCHAGDARVQQSILRLMGKTAPSWGKYPLVNGVV